MNKKINILLTDVNHPVTPRVTEILKNNKLLSIRIIGIDSSDENYGSLWVDKFYNVPNPESYEYIKKVLNICIKEKVDIIIPWTNIETLNISKNINLFNKNKIKALTNNYLTNKILVDKGAFYEEIKKINIPIPRYKLVANINELSKAIDCLGYPKNKVVIKPRQLSGGRGLFILSKKINLDTRNINHNLPKNALLEIFKVSKNKNNLNYLVMEYLSGEDFSVDTLCDNGKVISAIQRKRISDLGGVSMVGETVKDEKVDKIVRKIVKHFKINFNCNIQLRYRNLKNDKSLFVYDINPRISGTIVANAYSGIDLLTDSIYQLLKMTPNNNKKYSHVKMIRYWSEKYQQISKTKFFS